jgi:hypothetical protein
MAKKKTSTLSVAWRATGALFANLSIVLPVAAVMGAALTVLDLGVGQLLAPKAFSGQMGSDQSELIGLMLGWWGVVVVLEIVLGPLVVAMSIYAARTHTHGSEKASLFKALNFGLARYKHIFKWHAAAWLTIQLGMIVLVPGILFLLQYAFVDSILTLEKEKWPLARSAKLTRGRRGRIFALVLPWLLLTQVIGFAELWALQKGFGTLFALMSSTYVVNIWVVMVFYIFYEDRTRTTA